MSRGLASPLDELPVQYADYARRQRQWLDGGGLERGLDYWAGKLEAAPELLELPADRPRSAVQGYRGGRRPLRISGEVSRGLERVARRCGATMFMTLLAGFKALAARLSGQTDLVIGTNVANRHGAEFEPLIGRFANSIALRTSLAGNPTFLELLMRVRETYITAEAHQEIPFEMLVEDLQAEPEVDHAPIFQTFFLLKDAPVSDMNLPNLTLSITEYRSEAPELDLALIMRQTDDALDGVIEYNALLFDDSTIARMAALFETLLEHVAEDPERHLESLPLTDKEESQRLVFAFNDDIAS